MVFIYKNSRVLNKIKSQIKININKYVSEEFKTNLIILNFTKVKFLVKFFSKPMHKLAIPVKYFNFKYFKMLLRSSVCDFAKTCALRLIVD